MELDHLNLMERAGLARRSTISGRPRLAKRRLDAWRAQSPFDDPAILTTRLAAAGLTHEDFEAALAINELPAASEDDIAAFLDRLAALRETYPRWKSELARIAPFRADGLESFPALVGPLLIAARDRLLAHCRAIEREAPLLPDSVTDSAFSHLSGRVARMSQRSLLVELHAARQSGMLTGDTPEERFAHFRKLLHESEFAARLLSKYPVLARQLHLAVEQWESASFELISRYASDARMLSERFGDDGALGALTGLVLDAGDPHRDGRTVAFLDFDSGQRVVYKPRSMAVDTAFATLLAWLDARGFSPKLRSPVCLDRGRYGWAEFIERRDCACRAEIARFYESQGALLGLLHALCGTDFHHENLIACGQDPVPVDLETLMVPDVSRLGLGGSLSPPGSEIHATVMNVGLLPERLWQGRDGGGVDMSGLGADGEDSALVPSLGLEAAGTDSMRLVRKPTKVPPGRHLPRLDGLPAPVTEFRDCFERGFAAAYNFLATHRDALLAPDGPITTFSGAETRIILRPTYYYALILMDGFHPRFLADGLDRDLFFDRLWGHAPLRQLAPRLIEAERRALWRNDIPCFLLRADMRDMYTPEGESFEDLLPQSPLDRVRERLRALKPKGGTRQLWLVRNSIRLLDTRRKDRRVKEIAPSQDAAPRPGSVFLEQAETIGERIAGLSFADDAGHVSWLTCYPAGIGDWTYREAGNDLFGGLPGLALFFACLAQETGKRHFEQLAEGAWKTVRWRLARPDVTMTTPGAFNGWGGLLYVAFQLSRLLGDDDYLDEILARIPGPERLFDEDRSFDIIDGAAGFLAVALGLPETGRTALEAHALYAGEYLLRHAVETEGGGIGWPLPVAGSRPLGGFSHGAAGIAWSLFRLARAGGECRFLDAARRALLYDRSLFSPDAGNWRDLRAGPRPGETEEKSDHFVVAWCHGAPGIGLSRLLIREIEDDPALTAEIAQARKKTLQRGFGRSHCLCHGDLGNLDILSAIAHAEGDEELAADCGRIAAASLEASERHGWRTGFAPGTEPLGLMTGLAGIGFGLLRHAAPERVPSVLALAM